MSLENQGEEVSVLGRAPESQALLSGCVLAAILKHVVKHDLKLIENPDASWGRSFKKKKKQTLTQESTVGKKPKCLWTRAGRLRPLLHWPLGGAAAEHLVVHRLEPGQLAWGRGWKRVVGGAAGCQ